MTNNNMRIYEKVRQVPASAQKRITGGRLNGMTDINPMWRINMLTELYGPCGQGWYTGNVDYQVLSGANDEQVVICTLYLYVKEDEEWSKCIYGVGGSMLVAKERNGLFTSDEAFKMAYTDAISVACKALGFGADIYWANGRTKYSAPATEAKNGSEARSEKPKKADEPKPEMVNMETWWKSITDMGYLKDYVVKTYSIKGDLTREQGLKIYKELKEAKKND